MARLSPEDIEFIERITDQVQSSNALPFQIPQDRLPKIILRAAKFFWEWHLDATAEETLYIPYSEIQRVKNLDSHGNGRIQLPSGIEGIMQVYLTGTAMGLALRDALRIPLLDSYGATYKNVSTNAAAGPNFRDGYGTDHWAVSDSVIAMYEYSVYKQLFTKGIRFSFNRNTSILNLIGVTQGESIVLSCFTRTPLEALYNDYRFEDYVAAMVMTELGKIVMTFDFKLPGNVSINYDQIRSEGAEQKKEIEEELKNDQNAAGAIMIAK